MSSLGEEERELKMPEGDFIEKRPKAAAVRLIDCEECHVRIMHTLSTISDYN